jgi:hypothetical protein
MKTPVWLTAFCCLLAALCTGTTGTAAELPLAKPALERAPTGVEPVGQGLAAARLASLQHDSLSRLTALGEANGQVFGAGSGVVAAIGDAGLDASTTIPVPAKRASGLSAFTPGQLIVGDAADSSIFAVDIAAKQATKLFTLKELNARGIRAATVLQDGELAGLAFDGKFIYAGVKAGYSSSIFKIDPSTKTVVGHGWAPGPNPSAMQFYKGSLFVLEADRQAIRRLDSNLQLSLQQVDVPVQDGRGLVMSDQGAKVLSPGRKSIENIKFDTGIMVQSRLIKDLVSSKVSAGAITAIMAPQKYAVLICGDVAESGFDEFWNDTVWLYKTLRQKGYTKERIYVLYGNGTDYASANPTYQMPGETVTDFSATAANVSMVFDGLKNGDAAHGIAQMKDNDTLFVWTFDHGSGGPTNSSLCLVGADMTDTDFAAKLNAVAYEKRAVFMQQCRSGGFIDNLSNPKTFISTACRGSENAHEADTEKEIVGGKTYHHGEYNYYLISAFSGATPTGSAVNAKGADGKCSAFEAHQWVATHENMPEVPQYNNQAIGDNFFLD